MEWNRLGILKHDYYLKSLGNCFIFRSVTCALFRKESSHRRRHRRRHHHPHVTTNGGEREAGSSNQYVLLTAPEKEEEHLVLARRAFVASGGQRPRRFSKESPPPPPSWCIPRYVWRLEDDAQLWREEDDSTVLYVRYLLATALGGRDTYSNFVQACRSDKKPGSFCFSCIYSRCKAKHEAKTTIELLHLTPHPSMACFIPGDT